MSTSQSHRKRRRGVVLSSEGLRRLQAAIQESEAWENDGERYTLEALGFRIGIDPKTVAKVLEGEKRLDKRTLQRCFSCFNLELRDRDYCKPTSLKDRTANPSADSALQIDWGEAMDISAFVGRSTELEILSEWLKDEKCRAIAVLGMGGIGKTSLSIELAQLHQNHFDCIIWRSVRNAPPFTELFADLWQFLCREPQRQFPRHPGEQIRQFIALLRSRRCLIILDNWETLLCSSAETQGMVAGQYCQGYEGYGEFLQQVGETCHQSKILLTSREKPAEIATLEGKKLPVRTFLLQGLSQESANQILKTKGLFGSTEEYNRLSQCYQGNPLALKIVATAIQDIFAGEIGNFLAQNTIIFNGVRVLLDEQFQRLSQLERGILYWLAINREPISLNELRSDWATPVSVAKELEALESLKRRSLLESLHPHSTFTLQPVVMEYVTAKFIAQICAELATKKLDLFCNYALIKAESENYVRASQIQLILQPIIGELKVVLGVPEEMVGQFQYILAELHKKAPYSTGYAAGNLLNLLCHLNTDLTGYDFSNLTVWQAYLQETTLPQVNFSGSDLSKSVFAQTFSVIMSVAFSPDGRVLATANWDTNIYLWDVSSGNQLAIYSGHGDKVWSVAFHPHQPLLASGSDDRAIKLWDVESGTCLRTLEGHEGYIRSVAFNASGDKLASGSVDGTVRLWNPQTGDCIRVLQEHTAQVWSVAFSPTGDSLASAGNDLCVKLWDATTGRCYNSLEGHEDWIRAVAWSPDGGELASSSVDGQICLWDGETGERRRRLEGNFNAIFNLVFLPGQQQLASCALNGTLQLWNLETGACEKVLSGHRNSVYGLAVHPSGNLLASGSADQTARLWSLPQGFCLRAIEGRINWVSSVACSPDGTQVVSGSEDRAVRVWQVGRDSPLVTLRGHRDLIYSVAWSPNNRWLASSSVDGKVCLWSRDDKIFSLAHSLDGHTQASCVCFSPDSRWLTSGGSDDTAKLWEVETGQLLKTFPGHFIHTVVFSPDGQKLAIAAFDPVVKLWDIPTEQCIQTFTGHSDWAWTTAISPDGQTLATGSTDGTVRLWDIATGRCRHLLEGHEGWIFTVAISPDGQTLASAGTDCTIKLWQIDTGTCRKTLKGHESWVMSVAFNPQGDTLVSGGGDECLKRWEIATGNCLETWKAQRLYEGMNIVGAIGLSSAQKQTLKALGAVGI
ncbi:NB-ARC domain-containing protein [Lusitaniella coriacea]|uniref:NB-ARC domain-containing protein n=1 Tax=Lusitaniella coriacea TaxID=1983105 RepID=UPI003CEFCB9F